MNTLAGLFWVKDNNGTNASPASVRQIPDNDMVYVGEKLDDRILFGSDVFAAGGGAGGFLNERKVLETDQVTNGLHGGPKLEGFNLPDPVLNHIYYWNVARLIPHNLQ